MATASFMEQTEIFGVSLSSVFAMGTQDLFIAHPGTFMIYPSASFLFKFLNPELRQVMRKSVSVEHHGDLVSLFVEMAVRSRKDMYCHCFVA